MKRCMTCGAPLLKVWTAEEGFQYRCLNGCGAQYCDDADDGEMDAAKQAVAGLGWYRLEDADDDAMDRAEGCFHEAVRSAPGDIALMWAELMSRFGARWQRAEGDAALLLCRMKPGGRRLAEDADTLRLLDMAAGTDALGWFKEEVRRVDGLLTRAGDMAAQPDCDVFIALKTEEAGAATPEKRFCDDLYDQLNRVLGVKHVFYAPQTLAGKTEADFEPLIHWGLRTSRLLVIVADDPAHADAPWVRSEWRRYLAREDGHALVCCLDALQQEALPGALSSLPAIAGGDAGSAAARIYRELSAAPDAAPESPDRLFARAAELLSHRPEKAVPLLREAAGQKHPEAQLMLGRCYEWGNGVKPNPKEAKRWYLAAAGRGLTQAREGLDRLRLREDAERGVPSARAAMGALCLKGGDGFAPDPGAAAAWLRPAAEAGDAEACFLYGCMLSEGVGVEMDRRLGRRCLNQAKKSGHSGAAAYLRDGQRPW